MASCPTLVMMAAAWPPSAWRWDLLVPLVIGATMIVLGLFISLRSTSAEWTLRLGALRSTSEEWSIRLGEETLPAPRDVAAILVAGNAIPTEKMKALINALARAKRASSTGTIIHEVPFQITDHWGGSWDLVAYQESNGKRGFSIHRVYYSGAQAEKVAAIAGIDKSKRTPS